MQINEELLRVARDEVTKPRRKKQAAIEKEALIAGPPDPSQGAPAAGPAPGGAPPAGAGPAGPAPGAPAPGGAPPADPSQPGGPPLPAADPMSMIQQAVNQALDQRGMNAGGAGGGKGKGSKDMIPELHAQIYRSNALLTMIANAMGLQVPPEAVQGPPPEQPAQTPQPNPQPQPQVAPQGQDPNAIQPIQPMDGALPKAASFLPLDDEDEPAEVDMSKYSALIDAMLDEPEEKQAAPVGTVYDQLSHATLRHSPTLLAARLRERSRMAQ